MLTKLFSPAQGGFDYFSLFNGCKKAFALLLLFIVWQIYSYDLAAQPPVVNVSPATRALFQAIRSGSTSELEKQLTNGASVNDSLNSYSALMAAALSGSLEQMKMLIDHGANVNYIAQDGTNALWLAVPDWDKTKLLLDHGVDVQHTIGGYGILVKLAAMPGTAKIMQLLIEHGIDPKKSAPDNMLLYNAASSGDTANLGMIIRSGLRVNDTIVFGDYPINGALFYRNAATMKMLVENGANVNISAKAFQLEAFNGFTPLMYAAVNNDKPSFYYLLEHGADPNMKNKNGYTALMMLQQAEEDDPAMTMALLNHGAEPSIKTPAGNDALHFAMQKGNTQSVAILKKYTK
ncbi:MAG: ankyrin repeat domain-containing protein [Bacteroidota bacterium]